MNLHPNAIEFFQELANDHSMYPDTPESVVYQFIQEWEDRERTPLEYRVKLP